MREASVLTRPSLSEMPRSLSILLIVCGMATLAPASSVARRAFRDGKKAERAGDPLKAYLLYSKAAQSDPKNRKYAAKQAALQQSAALEPRSAMVQDPADETVAAQIEAEEIPNILAAAAPPPQLVASEAKQDFALKAGAKEIFEKVASAYGIRVLFAPDYMELPALSFHANEAGYREALRALEAASDSFVVPLDNTTALVARDTPQNRTQWTRDASIVVPIPERLSAQEAQELATAVQQTLEIRRTSMDATRRAIFFRDTVAKVFAAREMFGILSRARTQIAVEVELLSVSRTSPLAYGLSLPTSASIVDFGTLPHTAPSAIPSGSFAHLVGGGETLLGIGIGNATAIATLGRSTSASLLDSHLVTVDGQAVTFKVGQRYPVTTASFSAPNGSSGNGGGALPTINYIDLGLALKITPTVHDGGEVTLDVEAEFKSIGAGGSNGIPAINNQQYQGKVRLKDGEWGVVAGLVQLTRNHGNTGVAGLSSIPILGSLFRSSTREVDLGVILLVLNPRVIGYADMNRTFNGPIWTGTETRPATVF